MQYGRQAGLITVSFAIYGKLNERLDCNCSSKTSIYIQKEGIDNKVKRGN